MRAQLVLNPALTNHIQLPRSATRRQKCERSSYSTTRSQILPNYPDLHREDRSASAARTQQRAHKSYPITPICIEKTEVRAQLVLNHALTKSYPITPICNKRKQKCERSSCSTPRSQNLTQLPRSVIKRNKSASEARTQQLAPKILPNYPDLHREDISASAARTQPRAHKSYPITPICIEKT